MIRQLAADPALALPLASPARPRFRRRHNPAPRPITGRRRRRRGYADRREDHDVPQSARPQRGPPPRPGRIYRRRRDRHVCRLPVPPPCGHQLNAVSAGRAADDRRRAVRPPGAVGTAPQAPHRSRRLRSAPLRCRRKISRKPASRRSCRPISSANWSTSAPRSRPAPSSSIRRTPISISCSAAARRCATASASAAKASPGPAPSASRSMKEWPDWFPPAEMIERQPYLPRMMAGGPGNPLGARALYLGNTLYRIHGTNQPSTIGKYRLVGLHPPAQRGHRGSLQPRAGRHPRRRVAAASRRRRSPIRQRLRPPAPANPRAGETPRSVDHSRRCRRTR